MYRSSGFKSIYILTVFLILIISGCGGGGGGSSSTPAAVSGPYGVISGTILDPATKAPVSGAIVTLNNEVTAENNSPSKINRAINKAPLAMTLTDARGYYEFRQVSGGTYNLSVSKDGKFGAQFSTVVRAGETTTVPTVELTPIVTISGVVRIDTSVLEDSGMPQILVWVLGTSLGSVPEITPETDPSFRDFKFSISNVPAKTTPYVIRYYAENHISQEQSVSILPSEIPSNFIVSLPLITLVKDTTVDSVNENPTALLTADNSQIQMGGSVFLDGSSSNDPDGDPLTYHWSQTAGPPITLTGNAATMSVVLSQPGTYTFMLFVKDDHHNISIPALTSIMALSPTNTPPQALALASVNGGIANNLVSANQGDTITLNGTGSTDSETTNLFYRWVQIAGPSITFTSNSQIETSLATDSFEVNNYGSYRFALVVSDGVYESAPSYAVVEVNAPTVIVGSIPVAVANNDSSEAVLGSTVNFDSTGSNDPDGNPLTYKWSQLSGPVAPLSDAAIASPVVTPSQTGLYIYQLIVNDGSFDSLPDLTSFEVVEPVNLPPVANGRILSGGSEISVITAGDTIDLDGTLSTDPENDSLTYEWKQLSGTEIIIPDINSVTNSITLNSADNYSFMLTVNDGRDENSDFALVKVNPVIPGAIQSPVAVAASDTDSVFIGSTINLDASGSSDPDSLPITYKWIQVSGPVIALSDSNIVNPVITATEAGELVYQLIVSNAAKSSLPDYITINVVNKAPFVSVTIEDAGSVVNIVQPGTTIDLNGTGSVDYDNYPQILSYKWTQVSGPPVVINNATKANGFTTLALTGNYTFKLEVSDGAITRTSVESVKVNSRPVAGVNAPSNGILNNAVSFSGTSSYDSDGDTITYSWSQVGATPAAESFTGTGTASTESFIPSEIGTYTFQLIVNDGNLSSQPEIFNIEVRGPLFDSSMITVNENNPGVNDTVTGVAGALPGAYELRAYRDISCSEPLLNGAVPIETVSAGDGSFTLDLGDNNTNIVNNVFYISAGGANTNGVPLALVNDISPSLPPTVNMETSDKSVNNANKVSFAINGQGNPGDDIYINFKSINPVVTVASGPFTVDVNGDFSGNADLQILAEGDVIIEGKSVDSAGNMSNLEYLYSVLKDVTPPSLTVAKPASNGKVKLQPVFEYNLSETIKSLELNVSNNGPAVFHSQTITEHEYLEMGNHKITLNLDVPLTDTNNYDMSAMAVDKTGNTGTFNITNLTADGVTPSGESVSTPVDNDYISTHRPAVEYDLTSISETVTSGYVEVLYNGGETDPHLPMRHLFAASELSAANHPINLILPYDLQTDTVYDLKFVFIDEAGNESTPVVVSGLMPVDENSLSKIDILKPLDGGVISSNPVISYSLSQNVTDLKFHFVRTSGSGPDSIEVILNSPESDQGLHLNEILSDGTLLNNDIYRLEVYEILSSGSDVLLKTVNNLTVDTVQPQLVSATAIQSRFGSWTAGDKVIFEFSEPMDTTGSGGLTNIAGITANLVDTAASGDDWGDGSIIWSVDRKVLTFVYDGTGFGGTAFTAGDASNGGINFVTISEIDPSAVIKDLAGNTDNTGTPVKLISKGDTTPPVIIFNDPLDNFKISTNPVVLYELNEWIRGGTFSVNFVSSQTSSETLVYREWVLDPARSNPGQRSITFSNEGIPPLTNDSIYNFRLDYQDGAGNLSSSSITNLRADDEIPLPPDATDLWVENYSGRVIVGAESLIGQPGEYLRVYVDGALTATAAYPGPYGDLSEVVVISGLTPIPDNAAISYTLIDEAGNESIQSADGIMPQAPTASDISLLGIRSGTSDFEINNPVGLTVSNMDVYVNINNDLTKVYYSGWTDGAGNCSSSSNAIPFGEISTSSNIYYIFNDTANGHYSAYSAQDGTILQMTSVQIIDNDFNGNISPNDSLEITFTGNVEVDFGTSNFAYGQALAGAGNYQWSAAISDINVAPVSVSSASSISAAGFWLVQNSGSNKVYIDLNFSSFTVGPIQQFRVELNSNGTNDILSSNGGHCVLPSSQITNSGTTGGLITPDF